MTAPYLAPDQPRCDPTLACSVKGRCVRFLAARPQGYILRDYSREWVGQQCLGFREKPDPRPEASPAQPRIFGPVPGICKTTLRPKMNVGVEPHLPG